MAVFNEHEPKIPRKKSKEKNNILLIIIGRILFVLIRMICLVVVFYYFILIKKAIGKTLPDAIGKIVKYLEFFSEVGFCL